jgi:hypothetical protein
MSKEPTKTVREVTAERSTDAQPLRRLPRRTGASTKQMHERLLRALSDRRIKRSFS